MEKTPFHDSWKNGQIEDPTGRHPSLSESPRRRPPLRKSLGQHHLTDPAICRPLLEFLRFEDHRVVEIGPGAGVLTRPLLRSARSVLAVELDRAWAFHLARDPDLDRLELAIADAMDLDWRRLDPEVRLAGNLPYGISTALIERLLDQAAPGLRVAFLVQREVASRLLASPSSRDYGSLSVLFRARASGRVLGRVRPGSFLPPPKVESAFIGFELRDWPPPGAGADLATLGWTAFKRTVRAGFSQRRKTLRNCLIANWGRRRAESTLKIWSGDAGCRAESLPLEEWLALHRAFLEGGCGSTAEELEPDSG